MNPSSLEPLPGGSLGASVLRNSASTCRSLWRGYTRRVYSGAHACMNVPVRPSMPLAK